MSDDLGTAPSLMRIQHDFFASLTDEEIVETARKRHKTDHTGNSTMLLDGTIECAVCTLIAVLDATRAELAKEKGRADSAELRESFRDAWDTGGFIP